MGGVKNGDVGCVWVGKRRCENVCGTGRGVGCLDDDGGRQDDEMVKSVCVRTRTRTCT